MTAVLPPLTHRLEGDDGAVVLLLNGGMMTFATWEPVAGYLREDHRVLRCDLRGQLLTPGESHRELGGHVDDVAALLDAVGLDAVHVLGTSFGAAVGLLLAARRPRRVLSLAAVTTTDRVPSRVLAGLEDLRHLAAEARRGGDRGPFHDRLTAGVYSEEYRLAHGEELAERRRQLSNLPAEWYLGLDGILACLESLDLTSHLGRIRCPTLVVAAAADRIFPAEHSRALASAIDGAELVEHPRSGHGLVAEDPDWLAREYLSFLRRIDT